jgi:hypothetical protein
MLRWCMMLLADFALMLRMYTIVFTSLIRPLKSPQTRSRPSTNERLGHSLSNSQNASLKSSLVAEPVPSELSGIASSMLAKHAHAVLQTKAHIDRKARIQQFFESCPDGVELKHMEALLKVIYIDDEYV